MNDISAKVLSNDRSIVAVAVSLHYNLLSSKQSHVSLVWVSERCVQKVFFIKWPAWAVAKLWSL